MSRKEPAPREISEPFYDHIQEKRETAETLMDFAVGEVMDYCVDILHNDKSSPSGLKRSRYGLVVAGGAARRVYRNDIGIARPKEYMQAAVQKVDGHLVHVVCSMHDHCGLLWSEGEVTPRAQEQVRDSVWSEWLSALETLREQSPADGKRVNLTCFVGARGSAPTILRDGEWWRIVNPDYLSMTMRSYKLERAFVDQLVPEQRGFIRRVQEEK